MNLSSTIRACALILGVTVGAQANAAEPADSNDYAFGLDLTPNPEQAQEFGFRTHLPDVIYEQVTSDKLKDLAVFNADGELVPYTLYRSDSDAVTWHPLTLFSLDPTSADTHGRVKITTPSATVTVEGGPGFASALAASTQPSFILDTRDYSNAVRELKLTWTSSVRNRPTKVRVEASEDLNSWRQIGQGTLASLTEGENQLLRDTLIVPPNKSDYLRITPTEPTPSGWKITGAEASWQEHITPNTRTRTLAPDNLGRFETNGQFPIAALDLSVRYQSYAADVAVFSRATPQDKWRHRGEHVFSKTTSVSEPMRLYRVTDRYWKIEANQPLPEDTTVTVTWHPHELFWLAQGRAPYTLAFGNFEPKYTVWTKNSLATAAGDRPLADFVAIVPEQPPRTLGGEARLKAGFDASAIAVWVILALGTLFVLLLARASRKSPSPSGASGAADG